MAVLRVQIFALAGDDTGLTTDDQYTVYTHLTTELITLANTQAPGVVLLDSTVTPYDTGAVVDVVAMTDHADHLTDTVAAHLNTAMTGAPHLFTGWHLMAGDSAVWSSDN